MKNKNLIAVLLVFTTATFAQNVQTHYDFGKDRGYLTTTVEMFKPDKFGSTFFFVDMDYSISDNLSGVNMAYWEIARGIKFWDNPFEIHLEYNGGLGLWDGGNDAETGDPITGYYGINDAYLLGGTYTFASSDFSKIFTIMAMYKYIKDKNNASFQITGVWSVKLLDGKVDFTGFADFWREDNTFGSEEEMFVFLSEPQLWYNFCSNFAFGGEVEFGYNFAGVQKMKVCPTLGAKWTF